jgi:hypothetical protein
VPVFQVLSRRLGSTCLVENEPRSRPCRLFGEVSVLPSCALLILMTDVSDSPGSPQKWARLRPEFHGRYPSFYHAKWFRVYDTHPNPSVKTLPGYVWIDALGKMRGMWALHFEIAERERS